MMVCISSIKSIDFSYFTNSAMSPFRRFSKSPLYLVPANNEPISRENTVLPSMGSGTSPSTISFAKPSAMAVLPTPDSPTNSGLFLRRLINIWLTRSISASRPINGSIMPSLACSFKLVENWLSMLASAASSSVTDSVIPSSGSPLLSA